MVDALSVTRDNGYWETIVGYLYGVVVAVRDTRMDTHMAW